MNPVRLPQTKSHHWSGPFLDNYQGDLRRTFNIDLEQNPGHITLSKAIVLLTDTGTLANLGVVNNFIRANSDGTDRYWALVNGGRLMKTNNAALNGATWSQDALDSSPTSARDFTIHEQEDTNLQDILLVSTDCSNAALAALNDTASASKWTGAYKSLSWTNSTTFHPIEYFPFQRMTIIGDGNIVHVIDKTRALTPSRLTLPTYLTIRHIFVTPDRAWFCCQGSRGFNGAVVEWDGFSQTYLYVHDVFSSSCITGANVNGVATVVNDKGQILEYNGKTFVPMSRGGQEISFATVLEDENLFAFTQSGNLSLAPRGMTVSDNGLVYFNLGGPNLPSPRVMGGVWCLNPRTGNLYSKHSLNFGSDTDYGQQVLVQSGGIRSINQLSDSSQLLAGGLAYTDYSGTSKYGIWALHRTYSSTLRRGFFITQPIPSGDIQEMWDNIWMEMSKFRTSGSKIIVKAMGSNALLDSNKRPLEKTITWTSATTFTVTISASDDAIANGDEVEILAGKNSGVLAHITSISGAQGALQTVTIDESVTGTSGGSLCRFERWKKCAVIDDNSKYVAPAKIGITSSFIQLKIELRGPERDYHLKSLSIVPNIQQTVKL